MFVVKFFRSVFSLIWTQSGDLLCKFPYPVQMRENTDQSNSEHELFLCSENCQKIKRSFTPVPLLLTKS